MKVAAELDLGSEPGVVRRTGLFDVSTFDSATPHAHDDVSPDGRWFVFGRRSGSDHIVLRQNLPELARRMSRQGATP